MELGGSLGKMRRLTNTGECHGEARVYVHIDRKSANRDCGDLEVESALTEPQMAY